MKFANLLLLFLFVCATATPAHLPMKANHSCIVGPPLEKPRNLRDYTIETCAILIQFTDNRADTNSHTPARYDSMFYSTGVYQGKYRAGSLNDFFIENSYGTSSVVGGISGDHWHTSVNTYSYYDDNNYMLSNGYELASDAVALVDASVDFRQYDLNNDNHIDGVFIVHAGPGAEDTGDPHQCWSHAIPWFDYLTDDGITINGATNVPEINLVTPNLDTTLCCIGVMCHELGHVVGLPDLYDYSRNTWGVGYWSLMGYGAWGAGGNTPWSPSHADAWCKMQVNWLVPTPIFGNIYGLKIPDSETNPTAFRVWRNGIVNDTFFILENRQNKGFDAPLPGPGLLIWHIDPRYSEYHDAVDLEEADGCDDLDHGWGYRPDPHYYHHELGDAGDPYPGDSGTTLFDSLSYPSSNDNSGNPTNVTVRNISLLADTILCDILINPSVVNENQNDIINSSITIRPNPFRKNVELIVHNIGVTTAKVYDITGKLVRVLNGQVKTDYCSFYWDGRDHRNVTLPVGVYWFIMPEGCLNSPSKIIFLK